MATLATPRTDGIINFIHKSWVGPMPPRDLIETRCDDGTSVITAKNDGDTVRVERYSGIYPGGSISISALDDDGDTRVTFPSDMAQKVMIALARML